ncbi:MAG TPA: glycosyltransferase [Pseudonocardiaceae bacterium]
MSTVLHVTVSKGLGGVPEVVRTETRHLDEYGVQACWLETIAGGPARDAAAVLHRALYGDDRVTVDPAALTAALDSFVAEHRDRVVDAARHADAVVLHDPLPLAFAPLVAGRGRRVLWRCHIGHCGQSVSADAAQAMLVPLLDHIDHIGFLRGAYLWDALADDPRCAVLPPPLDDSSDKNRPLTHAEHTWMADRLLTTGYLNGGGRIVTGRSYLPEPSSPYLVQVARWDPLKGHDPLLVGFADLAAERPDIQLVLLGPHIDVQRNYPISLEIWKALHDQKNALPDRTARRVHLWQFSPVARPIEDRAVNMIQRRARAVSQNSIREGFGLTVTEAMWKEKVVVGTPVGGIADQITHQVNGLLTDGTPGGWAQTAARALDDEDGRQRWGPAARRSVADRYLVRPQLLDQLTLLQLL